MQQCRPVRRAPLSVFDKAGTIELTQAPSARGVELLSIRGTACLLAEKGLPVAEVFNYAGFLETMDGRVKTLHPKMHGSILGRHGQDDAVMEEHQIQPIDMAVINLYPSAQTIVHEGCSLESAVENIGIGDPTMMRPAAKSRRNVATVVKSSDCDAIIKEMDANEGSLTPTTRLDLTTKAFEHTATYDSMIASCFDSMVPAYCGESREVIGRFPYTLNLNLTKKRDMRYGKNSHQQAAFYIEENVKEAPAAIVTQIQGRAPFYNNIVDTGATLKRVKEFTEPACVTVKYADPRGVAVSSSILDAYDRTYKTDPTSAFGSIITFNRESDTEVTQAIISRQFVETIIAPSTSEEALKITVAKQNVRVLICGQWSERAPGLDFKRVSDGLLAQDHGLGAVGTEELHVVTRRQSTEQKLRDASFYRKVAKFVRSNAIIYAKNSIAIDIGIGQISRVCSAKIASIRAADEGLETKGLSMVSDVFSPSRDGVDTAAAAGVTCVIQPGGSIRDGEVIAAANEHNIVMLFTDMRHFRRQWSSR